MRGETEQQSRGQAMLAGENLGSQVKPLTSWKAENRQCHQKRNRVTKQRHSHPGKQRTGNVTRGETEKQSRGTHNLVSRKQAMSAGAKHSN